MLDFDFKLWTRSTVAVLAASLMIAGRIQAADISVIDNSSDLGLGGEFVYAVNFSPAGPNVEVDGTTFQTFTSSADVAGVTVTPDPIRSWLGTEGFFNFYPALGGDADVNNVIGTFIDSQDTANGVEVPAVDFGLDVNSGQAYRLQMLFSEGFFQGPGERVFDISIEGQLEVDDLDAYQVVLDAGITPAAQSPGAVLVSHDFVAGDDRLDITLTSGVSLSVISGLTLQAVPEPSGGVLAVLGLLGFAGLRKRSSCESCT